jgi:hypothetical protein
VKSLTYVEIDIDYCALRYGTTNGAGTCPAVLGTSSPAKCFNTAKTCPVRVSFVNAPVTLRFAVPAEYLPASIDAIPSVKAVSFTSATISLGENLGQRASLSIVLSDHRHPDTGPGFDEYVTERSYNPFTQGSFWGKFRARQPYLRGRKMRLIRGLLGQSLAEMDTRHYVIDSFDGPAPDGTYTLTAKDVLKLADDDRAQAPKLSNGFLVAAITSSATTCTLSPSGVGAAEYPASGKVAIGGKEICSFTRSGDVLTLTRAQNNTVAAAHSAQDRVQLVLSYTGADVADIISDLLQTYAGIPSGYVPLSAWQTETDAFLQTVYTAVIAEPTGVNKLVSELVEQAALAMWWDDANQQIRLQVLRAIPPTAAVLDDDNLMAGSLRNKEQPDKRLSQVWTYFAQRNPLEPLDNTDNYRSVALTVNLQAQSDYGTPAIKKVFSRWIPALGRTVALRLNALQLGRYSDPPRLFNFDVFRHGPESVVMGGGHYIRYWHLQDDTGARISVPVQVTRLNPGADRYQVEATEVLFQEIDGGVTTGERVLIVDSNINNLNLRDAHDSIYPAPTGTEEVRCIIEAGVIVGSASTSLPAFDVGSWPAGVVITLEVVGRIQGAGGNGATPGDGQPGGLALYVRFAITIIEQAGEIWGGGGGGAGFSFFGTAIGGGGGAGQLPGLNGYGEGTPATAEAGGLPRSPSAGDGGGPGLAGESVASGAGFTGGAGGAAGKAIDGVSYLTVSGSVGDRRGGTV